MQGDEVYQETKTLRTKMKELHEVLKELPKIKRHNHERPVTIINN